MLVKLIFYVTCDSNFFFLHEGLTLIFATLVPFFIVSSLLLLAFAYGFYIQDDIDECDNITNCYAWTLNGFFSGSEGTSDLLDGK
jgi:hypothetical protein